MCAQPHLFVVIICSCISRRVVLRMLCPASQLVCATSSTCRHTSSLVCVSSEAIGGIGVRALWSCDIDPVCLRIARSWKSSTVDHSSSHVFQDIWDTLPLDHRCVLSAHIAELQSLTTTSLLKKRKLPRDEVWHGGAALNADMQRHMMKHHDTMFTLESKCDCIVHKKSCLCAQYPEDMKVTREIVGSSCTEESPLGTQAGTAGGKLIDLTIWAARIRVSQPVYFQHENHQNMKWDFFRFWFEDLYALDSFSNVEPLHYGWPIHRHGRRYVWGIRRDHALAGSCADYVKSTARTCEMVGEDLFVAPREEIQREFQVVAQRRRYNLKLQVEDAGDWSQYYAPGMRMIHQDHAGILQDSPHIVHYVADLDQKRGHGPKAGAFIPTLITHATVHSFKRHHRAATPREHLIFQGIPVYPDALAAMGLQELPFSKVLATLSGNQICRLAGNGMFLPGLIYQDLYILSRLKHGPSPDIDASLHAPAGLGNLDFENDGDFD